MTSNKSDRYKDLVINDTVRSRMTIIFNEWARLYAEDPAIFSNILDGDGEPASDYGEICAITFHQIAYDLDKAGALPTPKDKAVHHHSPLLVPLSVDRKMTLR